MSEYSDITSINKFVGTSAGYIGYDDNSYILSKIKDNPNAVIIFDEIDKAHPKIINLLYQMLEDGKIKDAKNNDIYLNNNIIILTTNIGSEKQEIGFNKNNKSLSELNETFNKALINRIDNIIIFNELTKDNIKEIIKIHLKKLKEKYINTNINIDSLVIDEIINETKYEEYGARQISKIINNTIENIIIDSIIENKKEINIDSIYSK